MVRGDWIKPGATVIDVGINRVPGADGKTRLVGDVAFAGSVSQSPARSRRCRAASGQMTVACLLVNTLRAACAIRGLPTPWGVISALLSAIAEAVCSSTARRVRGSARAR